MALSTLKEASSEVPHELTTNVRSSFSIVNNAHAENPVSSSQIAMRDHSRVGERAHLQSLGSGLLLVRIAFAATVFPLLGYGLGMTLAARLTTFGNLPLSGMVFIVPFACAVGYGVRMRQVAKIGAAGLLVQAAICTWLLWRNQASVASDVSVASILVIGPAIALCFLYDLDKAIERSFQGN